MLRTRIIGRSCMPVWQSLILKSRCTGYAGFDIRFGAHLTAHAMCILQNTPGRSTGFESAFSISGITKGASAKTLGMVIFGTWT